MIIDKTKLKEAAWLVRDGSSLQGLHAEEAMHDFELLATPDAVLELLAENEALRQALQAITAQVDGNIRPTVRDCVNGQNNVQDIYGYCDQIESIAAAAMKEPQP
ncbi:hypothetical protein [Pseudomonas sp. Z1-6]|uniref:hypothetical protein n=1 Tax=Pseudomonas sp. Z1-6 TaxID=2817407 RepID=UPI003DA9DAC6